MVEMFYVTPVVLPLGVTLEEKAGICIPFDSAFWALPEADRAEALSVLRGMEQELKDIRVFRYCRPFQTAARFARNKLQYMMQATLDQAVENMQANRLATEEEKAYCHEVMRLRAILTNRVKPGPRSPDPELRNIIIERDKGVCRYCGKEPPPGLLQIDHVVPFINGGPTDESNLVVSCFNCNHRKHDRTPEEAGMALLSILQTYNP